MKQDWLWFGLTFRSKYTKLNCNQNTWYFREVHKLWWENALTMPVSMRNLKAYVRAWMKLVRLACVQPGGCTQATKFCNLIDCLTMIRISAKLKDKTTSQTVNDRLHTRLGTLGSLSHNFKSSSECTKAAFALLIGLLNDWAPFSRNAIFKLARETVSQKNKPLLTRVGYPLTTEQVSGRGFRFFINFEWRLFLIKDICLVS